MSEETAPPKPPRSRATRSRAKAKAPPKGKPDKEAPKVCSSCGEKWARLGKNGLCSDCAKGPEEELPQQYLPPGWPEDKPPPTPQEIRRSRVFHIAQLMASGEWRSSMAKSLAKQWSTPAWEVKPKTVQHYSAEASRLLDYTTGQRETLVKIARVRLLEVMQQDENDRVQAMRTLLEHLGELRQINIVQPADPFAGWSEEEADHYSKTGEMPERLKGGPKE